MYVTVEKFQSNSAYTTEENAAWPLDSAPMGIKAEPALQNSSFGVINFKFRTMWFQNSQSLAF